jgi:hypothetical protein
MHAIVGALKDFPEAREKVLEAIRPITNRYEGMPPARF